ncbi:MAG: adenylate/guanylate cyclase domain-containing protein [Deltaproteobacteria bacterium]|nr:adenylate/guanylate cyclase domain-containing protein [Deltaproteobacteria bacterium]
MSDDPGNATQAEQRRLAAIMFTDIKGFSRQMGADEAGTLRRLDLHNRLIEPLVAAHHGTVIKTVGDAFLVDFPSVVQAVQCARQIQAQLHTHNGAQEKAEQIHVRIGIHLGDIVQKDGDVFGDGVNVASRLQGLAEPDTICISQKVYEEVENKLALGAAIFLGKPKLKNIAQRFGVYLLLSEPPTGLRQRLQMQRLKLSRRVGAAHRLAVLGVVLVTFTFVAVRYFPSLFPNLRHPIPSPSEMLALPDKSSIVVLPFTNMSEDSGQDYFSDGITEDITSDLSKISSLFVIARNSAFTYKGKAVKVQDVSREMGVRYVLEGSVRKANDQVRITAQLIDATTGGHLWSERYDRPLKDIFALQDEIRQKIVAALAVKLTDSERERLARRYTNSLEAYEYFLRGEEYSYRFTKDAHVQARQMYEKAIELDPKFAWAYAKLGWLSYIEWGWQWDQNSRPLERAFELIQKAVALDDSLPEIHRFLGSVYLWKKQHNQAIAEAERAITLDPNDADAYAGLGYILNYAGRPEETIGLVEKAMRLNPRYPVNYLHSLGLAYRLTGRDEGALAAYKRALARNPDFLVAHFMLAAIYSELGQEEKSRTEVTELLRLSPGFSLEVARQRVPYKDQAELERLLTALRKAGLK